MPKLHRLSGKEIITTLEKLGFQQVRQKGSHVVLKRQTSSGEVGCVVPLHREVAIGTIHGIPTPGKAFRRGVSDEGIIRA